MKIKSFAINNFKCINGGLDNNRIVFDDSNTVFIFGKNNVGKSTFLQGYEFYIKDEKANKLEYYFNKNMENVIEFELEVIIDNVDLRYIEDKHSNKSVSFKSFLSTDNIIKIKRTSSFKNDRGKIIFDIWVDQTFNFTNDVYEDNSFASIGLMSVFQELLPKPIYIKAMPTEQEAEELLNTILKDIAEKKLTEQERQELAKAKKQINNLQDKMYNKQSMDSYKLKVNDYFSKLFEDLQIDIGEKDKTVYTVDKIGKLFDIKFNKKDKYGNIINDIPNTFEYIGHGAIRTSLFCLMMLRHIIEEKELTENRKEYLILFEEPELFLHPELLKRLREMVYEVGSETSPYQILCASHSPQMIDISKEKSSLVRMVKNKTNTKLYQINKEVFEEATDKKGGDKSKTREELFEVLRFNPYICESFYADEVVLVEGPTEEIIIRGILQKEKSEKDLFIVNCNSVNNIPFYQTIFSKFDIIHHIIHDQDEAVFTNIDVDNNKIFTNKIQKTIYDTYKITPTKGLLRVHDKDFEDAHSKINNFKYIPSDYIKDDGKPFNANKYWKEVIEPNYDSGDIEDVIIIKYVREILNFTNNQNTDNNIDTEQAEIPIAGD